jgi:dienelactone hydrolase
MRERLSVLVALAVGTALLATGAGAGTQNAGVRLVVTPPTSLLDQPVNVEVVGLHPRQTITLVTETKDVLGKPWRSRLAYRADQHGRVNTHGHMRLLWALEPIRKSAEPSPFIPTVGPTTVTIRAVAGKRTLATGVLVRRAGAHVGRTDATLANEGFVGAYFAPGTGARGPAVLQLGGAQGSYGYFPAAVLAGHGYPTLSLAYFNEPGLPTTLKEVPLEYFAKALRWLAEEPGVDPNRILVYGVGRGAEAALLVGWAYPQLVHGVIASSSSADVLGGIPGPSAAWTLAGNPVPEGPIPVWQIAGPVLAFGGGKDLYYSSAYAVHEIVERAHDHGRPDIAGRVYPDAGAGVGFAIPNLPTYGRVVKLGNHYIGVGGTPGANVRAWAASWPLVLRFVRTMPA